tara:strand:+ start:3556 stop:5040 length:1485 start_codon:yes stop_codon:yes gene_type:complete
VNCDYRCFLSATPYDSRCDKDKLGTAFLLRLNGIPIIVTAHHVVSNAVSVTVTSPMLGDGEARPLRIIGFNPYLDIAILVGPDEIMNLKPFYPQRSSNLKPQHGVTCVGFAAGTLRTHTTSGTVSGRNDFPHNRIQTDTTVNPGNSGGPMIDSKTRRVIGIVTSGMDDMQTTNFFTPMDEAWQSIRRIITRYREHGRVGIDYGFHMNAVVRSVNSAACHGERGGAYVVATDPSIGLYVGDVILSVAVPQIESDAPLQLVQLNASMRVNVPSIWAYDAIDFRSIFDALIDTNSWTSFKMLVRRSHGSEQGEIVVDVRLQRAGRASRELFPDCEPIVYVTFGGLVIQTLGVSHRYTVPGVSISTFDKPEMEMVSIPAITHVASGSPFSTHGNVNIPGSIIKTIEGVSETRDVKTLEDVDRALREIDPIVLVLHNGYRIGALHDEITKYDSHQKDDALRRGRHTVMNGPLSMLEFDSADVTQLAPESRLPNGSLLVT